MSDSISPVVQAVVSVFEESADIHHGGTHPSVSRTVSTLAVAYEKARNAVEFRAEHLVRRAAIERILKRRILLNGGSQTIADNLVVELLWAKYIESALITDSKIAELQHIINRYLTLKHTLFEHATSYDGVTWESLLGLASAEIDETIVSAKKRQALNDFFYQAIRPRITLPAVDEQHVNMQTYIAVERAFAQADDALILLHLVKNVCPSWFTAGANIADIYPDFLRSIKLINAQLKDPANESLTRFVRRHTPPFLLLRDFFFERGDKARDIIENKAEFEKVLAELAHARYQLIGAKVRRAVVRSIIYIFLTKMIFALALEAPYDIFIAKHFAVLPLLINTLFPPVLLFLVAGFATVPGPDNTKRLIEHVRGIIYGFENYQKDADMFISKKHDRRPILTAVFSVFYLITFLISFGLISFVLTKLQFNIASQTIFVFFITLVSFFAYRIRQSAKEYEVVERQGFIEPLVDLFFLPILRAGHFLSREIAKINIFIFLFDFILEAPLKVIFEVVEEWIRFIRIKKEEIV